MNNVITYFLFHRMGSQKDDNVGGKHTWTTLEDTSLVECLVQMKTDGTGFNKGYYKDLEEMLKEKLPNCGLKANPHIMSRIRTMKKQWQLQYDMVQNKNTYGFGWDPEKKCVIAEDHVWDEYIKVMTYYMLFILTFDNTLIITSFY